MSQERFDAQDLTELVDAACHDSLLGVGPTLDAELWEPVAQAVRQARDAHREAMAAAGVTEPCPQAPDSAREAAAGYVTAVASKVQGPFLEALRKCDPTQRVETVFGDALARSREDCAALPGVVELPRGTEELRAAPEDGWARRMGRAVARVLAALGMGGRVRSVKVRNVALRHRALRLVAGGERWRNEALRRWGIRLTEMETVWGAWVGRLLPRMAQEAAPSAEPATDLWEAMAAAAQALDDGLSSLLESCPHRPVAKGLEEEAQRWHGLLASDLSVAGTFLLDPTVPAEPRLPSDEVEGWRRWQGESLARLEMHAALLGVFCSAHRTRVEMAERLRGEALQIWEAATAECASALLDIAAVVGEGGATTAEALERARIEAEAVLTQAVEASPTRGALEALSLRVAGLAVGSIQSGLREVPATVEVHGLPSPGRPLRRPTATTHALALQEMARQAFDALRMERIRTAPGGVVTTAEVMAGALGEAREIVAFGFDAGGREVTTEAQGGGERARELVVEGLERAAAAVRDVPGALAEAIAAVDRTVTQEVLAGFGSFQSRALAHRVQGQLLEARLRIAGLVDGVQRWAGPGFQRAVQRSRIRWLRLRRTLSRLLRRGKSLVGAEDSPLSAAARTARLLAAADEMVEALPLVYQHLFSVEPVTDEALLVGREVELAEAERRWHQWREGEGIPLLVTGRRGCGVSSFFHVFVGRLEAAGHTTQHHELDERIIDEEGLASHLAALLGFQAIHCLDDLAAAILKAPHEAVPDLMAVEGLEHVYLRIPGGTDLLERLFTLMAETGRRIFWMASLTSSAWQVVEKAEPAAAVQMDRLELGPLSVAHIQAAVTARHRRSGLRLLYEEPTEGRRILKRRLRRLRGTDRHQELLAADYFERLHRSAQGNLRLAFFQWLRSIDFGGSNGAVRVSPLVGLDWSFLEALDLTQNFTIKAFLEHQTLTLGEHDAVFRATRQESYHIFESLVNRQIIETVEDEAEEERRVSDVVEDRRYRIRPLLTGAVASHLASRNIVH